MNLVHARRRAVAAFWDPADATAAASRVPATFGWHESSHELSRGLEVIEHASLDTAPCAEADPEAPAA